MLQKLFKLHQKSKKILPITLTLIMLLAIIILQLSSNEYSSINQRYFKKLTLPYGTSVLYNSLQDILGKENVTDFRRSLKKFPDNDIKKSSIFIIGASNYDSGNLVNEAYNLAKKGANVIISFGNQKGKNQVTLTNFNKNDYVDFGKKSSKEVKQNIQFTLNQFNNHAVLNMSLPELIKSPATPTTFMPHNLA